MFRRLHHSFEQRNEKFIIKKIHSNRFNEFCNSFLIPLLFCTLQFGKYQSQIEQLTDQTTLPLLVEKRKKEILLKRKHWEKKLQTTTPFLDQKKFGSIFENGTLTLSKTGCGGAYFLYDEHKKPCYVIKPVDEDYLCLNNPKQGSTPFFDSFFRVRSEISLYQTAQAEALSFAVAHILGFKELTPKTDMMILSHSTFFDLTENKDIKKEKLCSVQEYLEEIVNLGELAKTFLESQKNESQILELIDRESFENLYLLIWLLYDNDAHAGNLYAKQNEKGTYHLIKLDNGLTFPLKNRNYLNDLFFLPHAKSIPSERLHFIVMNLPVDKIVDKIRFFELDDAIAAFEKRVKALQNLISSRNLSFREIDIRYHCLD